MESLGTINIDEATLRLRRLGMRISPTVLRLAIEQEKVPFGMSVSTEKGKVYFVYSRLLDEWIEERKIEN